MTEKNAAAEAGAETTPAPPATVGDMANAEETKTTATVVEIADAPKKRKRRSPRIKKPGIYHNLSDERYFAIEAANNSKLGKLDPVPALAVMADKSNGGMVLGSAVHTLVLEPERFDERYLLIESTTRTTKIYKAAVKEEEENPSGRKLLITPELADAKAMVAALYANPRIRLVLDGIEETEISVVWTDDGEDGAGTGLLCKAKIDFKTREIELPGNRIIPAGALWDLKTAHDIGKFARKAVDFGYFRQFSYYEHGYRRATGIEPPLFGCVAVQSSAPYSTGWYYLPKAARLYGTQEWKRLLRIEADCQQWGYPSYIGDGDIQSLTLPNWIKVEEETHGPRQQQ